jgi:hypothetical protein
MPHRYMYVPVYAWLGVSMACVILHCICYLDLPIVTRGGPLCKPSHVRAAGRDLTMQCKGKQAQLHTRARRGSSRLKWYKDISTYVKLIYVIKMYA